MGSGAQATGSNSTAIGAGAVANTTNQFTLGTNTSTYYLPGLGTTSPKASPSGATSNTTASGYIWAYKEAGSNTAYYMAVPSANSSDSSAAAYIEANIKSSQNKTITVGIVGNTTIAYSQQTNYTNYTTSGMAAAG